MKGLPDSIIKGNRIRRTFITYVCNAYNESDTKDLQFKKCMIPKSVVTRSSHSIACYLNLQKIKFT